MNVTIIFFSLIYNEIIILKICSLEKNTAKYISMNQKIEYDENDKHDQLYYEDEELGNSVENITSIIEVRDIADKK